ncbi:MAG: hypothetical protein ACYSTY_13655 [Planctomycetota bacterium]|jgi:hypothetical protein
MADQKAPAAAPKTDKAGRNLKTKLTAAAAAELVHRLLPVFDKDGRRKVDKDGNPVVEEVAVRADEVMSFAEYDDRVVVVTIAGEKLVHAKKD